VEEFRSRGGGVSLKRWRSFTQEVEEFHLRGRGVSLKK